MSFKNFNVLYETNNSLDISLSVTENIYKDMRDFAINHIKPRLSDTVYLHINLFLNDTNNGYTFWDRNIVMRQINKELERHHGIS